MREGSGMRIEALASAEQAQHSRYNVNPRLRGMQICKCCWAGVTRLGYYLPTVSKGAEAG
jgi:hypothetical protein